MKVLPENILRCMSKADREALGQMTAEEALLKAEVRDERDLRKLVAGVLGIKGIEFISSRTDKRTTQRRGVPDFLFAIRDEIGTWRQPIAFELKCGRGELSVDQKRMFIRLSSPPNCWRCVVIRSVEQAFAELKRYGL